MTKHVLSIDGGGIRGIGPAHMLAALDRMVRKSAAEEVRLSQCFDLFVGTSTGCILAGGLAADAQLSADLSPEALEKLYRDRGRAMFTPDVFGSNPLDWSHAKYKTRAKGRVLQEILGDLTLGELDRNFMGTYYNIGASPGPVFAHGGPAYRANPKENKPEYAKIPVWEVIDASSSAPVYFDPALVEAPGYQAVGVDGGMFANNPAMCAYVEAIKLWGPAEEIVVASFGCGYQSVSYPQRSTWGVLEWASPAKGLPILQVISHGQSETVSHQAEHILGSDRFYRFDFCLDGLKVRMDDPSVQNLDRIIAAADVLLASPACQARMAQLAARLRP